MKGLNLNTMRDGKAPGPDNVHIRFLKLLGDDGIKWLTAVFNRIYDTGSIPLDWLKSEYNWRWESPRSGKCADKVS